MLNQLSSLKLKLLNIGYAKLDHKWDFDNVLSPFARMYLITVGTAYIYHNNMKFELKPGYMYLIPSFSYSRYKCDDYHEQYYISFIQEVGKGLSASHLLDFKYELRASEIDQSCFERLLEINPDRVLLNDDPMVYDNMPSLINFSKKNDEMSAKHYIETHGILKILFSRFIENTAIKQDKTAESNLKKVLIYISENLHEDLTVDKLADFSNLSRDHFSRSFYKKLGMRPNLYIQSKRVERAQLLLLTTNAALVEIAEKVGFGNVSYFSKIFKKFIGQTPGYFRKGQLDI